MRFLNDGFSVTVSIPDDGEYQDIIIQGSSNSRRRAPRIVRLTRIEHRVMIRLLFR